MIFDTVEAKGLNIEKEDISNHLRTLHKGFSTTTDSKDGCYQRLDPTLDDNLARLLGIENTSSLKILHPTLMDSTKEMLYGVERNGFKTMGLDELGKWKLDPHSEYYYQNLRQQSGYAAEIISTYKENLLSKVNGLDLTTYRADDLPELYQRNDQYVDKVRVNANGKIIERIQTKFVGKNGNEWLAKMMSPKFEKYLDGQQVDKLECPKNYYDDVKTAILGKKSSYEKQLARMICEGKTDVAKEIQYKIDKLNKIDKMVEKSTVTSGEAMAARLNGKVYATKVFSTELTKMSNAEGLKGGAMAAGITIMVSAVENISAYVEGEISIEEMMTDIAEKTAAAGVLGYGTEFISTAVAQTMRTSSSQLIRTVGGSCLPAAVISFAVESYDSISDFAQGDITGEELTYDLGENASVIAGGIAGAKIGATIGTVVGPAGTVIGGIVGGTVGCVVASEAYKTAIQIGAEGAEILAEKAKQFASSTIDTVSEYIPEQLDNVKNAFSDFVSSVDLPFVL